MSSFRNSKEYEQEVWLSRTNSESAFVSQKLLATTGGVVDPVKIFLSSSLITKQKLVTVSHTVCAHVGGPKDVRTMAPRLLRMRYAEC